MGALVWSHRFSVANVVTSISAEVNCIADPDNGERSTASGLFVQIAAAYINTPTSTRKLYQDRRLAE